MQVGYAHFISEALPKLSITVVRSHFSEDSAVVKLAFFLTNMDVIENERFPYLPLDTTSKQIRLLNIHPGSEPAAICCSISCTSLASEEHTKYEAISYCWGDIKARETIDLDGRKTSITQSAGNALRAVRRKDEARVVWLDAICINQQDVKERGAQVSMMGDIYRAATRALVWLGEDDGTFGVACQLMTSLVRQLMDQHQGPNGIDSRMLRDDLKNFEWDSKTSLLDVRTHGIPAYDSTAWDALEQFFCRKWFTRTWVLQEIVLSQRPLAFCGHRELDWVVIQFAASWITRQRYAERSQRWGLTRTKNVHMVWSFGAKSSLDSLLLLTKDFQATDPRDKVFGLLGMATDCRQAIPPALKPDYLKSTPDVFSDATRYIIKTSKCLDVLSHIGFVAPFEPPPDACKRHFPSWVPRWDLGTPRTLENYSNTVALGRVEDPYSASGASVAALDDSHNSLMSLRLQGLRIDRIKLLSSIVTDRELATTDLATSIWNTYASELKAYPTGEELLRAFSLTMVADSTLNKTPASRDSQHDHDFAAYITSYGSDPGRMIHNGRSSLYSDASKGDAMRYGAAAVNAATGRSFCTTEAGWMGLCPPTAKEGDLVCMLFGGKVLYVIRRNPRYSVFIGECYIHGRMDGSGLRHQLRTHAPSELFDLR